VPASGSSEKTTTPTPTRITPRRLLEIDLGFIIGLFGGAVGLILGQLRLPAMIEVLRVDPRIAAGTNLATDSTIASSAPVDFEGWTSGRFLPGPGHFFFALDAAGLFSVWLAFAQGPLGFAFFPGGPFSRSSSSPKLRVKL
jgi:uncharacterized membrane protein YfcA